MISTGWNNPKIVPRTVQGAPPAPGANASRPSVKSGTVRRELTLPELVIPDLKEMDASGKFDRNVLLWLQDGWVSRAIKEHTGELLAFHRDLRKTDQTESERWARQTEFLTKITKETYSSGRAGGGGFDLKSYVEAAKTFYESEATLYAGQLADVADYIKRCAEAGVPPDLERFARDSYVSMARMGGAMKNLEGLRDRAGAQQVVQMMKHGIERINFAAVTAPGQKIEVGREMLKLVNQIMKAPEKYMTFVDPNRLAAPKDAMWDFEPHHRDSGDNAFSSVGF